MFTVQCHWSISISNLMFTACQVQYQSGHHCSRWSQSEKQHSVSCWKWGRIILYNISRELGFKQVAKNTKFLQIHQISLGSTRGGVKVSLYTPPKLGNSLWTVWICLAGNSQQFQIQIKIWNRDPWIKGQDSIHHRSSNTAKYYQTNTALQCPQGYTFSWFLQSLLYGTFQTSIGLCHSL